MLADPPNGHQVPGKNFLTIVARTYFTKDILKDSIAPRMKTLTVLILTLAALASVEAQFGPEWFGPRPNWLSSYMPMRMPMSLPSPLTYRRPIARPASPARQCRSGGLCQDLGSGTTLATSWRLITTTTPSPTSISSRRVGVEPSDSPASDTS